MSSTTEEISRLGARWVDAELAGDVEVLDALVADDFRLVGPFGFVLDKEQWLERYRSGDFKTTVMTWHDVDVREHDGSVIAIGTQSQEAAYRGAPSNGEFRITHVFVRAGDDWIIAGMHLSPTAVVPPAPLSPGAPSSPNRADRYR